MKGLRHREHLLCRLMLLVLFSISSYPAFAQNETTLNGTVASSSRNTLTVRTGTGQFQLFVFSNDVRKPSSLPVGAQVRVVSSAGNEPGVRVASEITVVQQPSANAPGSNDVVPSEIRTIERQIERQTRRYQLGVRGGVGLDPELLIIGAQAQIGPFFKSNLYFRPNVEFGFGEVTALFAFNPEMIYRLPMSSPSDRWSTYFGAGLGINLLHQSFQDSEKRIDFGDFHSDTALNILGGLRNRNGMFLELRTSVYSQPSPTLRMMVGYTF